MLTNKVKELITNAGNCKGKVKIVLENEVIFIDCTEGKAQVTNDDLVADCTIHISSAHFDEMLEGELSPVQAFIQGKMKIKGDIGIAMKLASLLS